MVLFLSYCVSTLTICVAVGQEKWTSWSVLRVEECAPSTFHTTFQRRLSPLESPCIQYTLHRNTQVQRRKRPCKDVNLPLQRRKFRAPAQRRCQEREEKKKREEKETREEEGVVSCMQHHFETEVSELKLSSQLICADTSYVQARICTFSLCLLCYYLFLKAYL